MLTACFVQEPSGCEYCGDGGSGQERGALQRVLFTAHADVLRKF